MCVKALKYTIQSALECRGKGDLDGWIKSEKGILGRGTNIDKGMNAWHSVVNLGPAVVRSLSLLCKDCETLHHFLKTPVCTRCLLSDYTASDMPNLGYLLSSWTVLIH